MENKPLEPLQPEWTGTTGATQNADIIQEPGQSDAQGTKERAIAISSKPHIGEPVTRPVFIPYDAARLLIKQSAIRHKKEIERYIEAGGISVVFDAQNNFFNSFNMYTERVVLGLLFELDRQSENGMTQWIRCTQQWKRENRAFEQRNKRIAAENKSIAKWNAEHRNEPRQLIPYEPLPNPTPFLPTKKNGGHVVGYDIDRFTPDEWAHIVESCNIKHGEPFVVVDIPQFVHDWFGIEPQGGQYEVYRRIISDLGKTDFVYLDNERGEALRTQLFTTYDGILQYSEKKRYAIVKVNPIFLRNIADKFLKAPENLLKIVQQTHDNMGVRLFLKFMEDRTKAETGQERDAKGRRIRRKRNAPIVKPYPIRELILQTAEEADIKQRKWARMEKRLFEQLEMLKNENVLLDYTPRELACGIVTVHINPQPFTRKVEPLRE